jgi:hypothetical protein
MRGSRFLIIIALAIGLAALTGAPLGACRRL